MNLAEMRRARAEMIAKGTLPERRRAEQSVAGSTAKIYLDDAIDSWGWPWGISAREFRQALNEIDADEIELHINSPGGECPEGVAIMNHLRDHKATVTAYVDGWAASAASVVMLGADTVLVSPGGLVMVHDAWTVAIGDAEEMRTAADFIEKVSQNMADLYAAKTGKSADEMRDLMRPKDTWLTADEAVEVGLADGVDDSRSVAETEQAKAKASALVPSMNAPDSKEIPFRITNSDPAAYDRAVSRARAAIAASQTPSAEPVASTIPNPTLEVTVAEPTTLRDGVLARLGVTDTAADDATVLAALDEVLAEQATASVALTPPDGTVLVSEGTLAALQASAQRGEEAYQRQVRDDREAALSAAVRDGQITPAERPRWQAKLEADPEAVTTLQGLPKGLVPVAPIGHDDDGSDVAARFDTPEMAAFEAALGLPQGSLK